MPDSGRSNLTTTLARVDRPQMIAVAAWLLLALGVQVLGAPLAMFTSFGPGPGFFLKSLSVILLILALLQGLALISAARAVAEPAASGHRPSPLTSRRSNLRAPTSIPGASPASSSFARRSSPMPGSCRCSASRSRRRACAGRRSSLLQRRPLRALIEAVVAALLVRYAFTAGLGVPLPEAQLQLLERLGF